MRVVLGVVMFGGLLACDGSREWEDADVSERLGPGEVRAGRIADEAALFGGVSAQGQPGDLKIYNDRVQFVIQGIREGNYYVIGGGGVIDADVVRPEGQLGRDPITDWVGMYGVGRLLVAEDVTVVNDGSLGDAAVIRVTGGEGPLELLTGSVESDDLVEDLGLRFVRDYVLEPDSWKLEVRTTVKPQHRDVSIPLGDIVIASRELFDPWDPGVGLNAPAASPKTWTGFMGRRNDLSLGILAQYGHEMGGLGIESLMSEARVVAGFVNPVDIPQGSAHTHVRYYALGPDLATITEQDLRLQDTPADVIEDQVTAPDGPVAGARVDVWVDDAPFTAAVTDAEGSFRVKVPSGADVRLQADGRGDGWHLQLPAGAAPYAPHAVPSLREAALKAFEQGAVDVPFARGRGIGTQDAPLELAEPGWVKITSSDVGNFEVRLSPEDARPELDERVHLAPAGDHRAVGWARDGELRMAVEPGVYHLLAHRGARYELDEVSALEVSPGEEVHVEVDLPKAYEHEGWIFGDPHQHASPSADGRVTMEERLISSAGQGVQIHFGTDHDHIADYNPLLGPLGLDGVLASVVADEVSPVVRGHYNLYPVTARPEASNAGAWRWWEDRVANTEALLSLLRERHEGAVLQANHPMRRGVADHANWSPGHIGRPDYWGSDFDAVEALNKGRFEGHLDFYVDLVNRGMKPTPVGVSDTHGHDSSGVGFNGTFFGMGFDDPAEYTDDALLEVMAARRTIVTRGPFLHLSIPPGSTVGPQTEVQVEVRSPSWMQIDRVVLWRNGEPDQTVQGNEATFVLDGEEDAWFTVVAEGDEDMPIYGRKPRALSSAIFMDVDGDGWTAPLPPLGG